MGQNGNSTPGAHRRKRGFERTGSLLTQRIRQAGEKRGFAVSRLLTHWPEVVGEQIAAMSRPVKVHYGRQGLGATLTLLTTGANAPLLEMQKPRIRDKVNACYGYAAIAQIRITQTAPDGFAEPQAAFDPAPKHAEPDAETRRQAAQLSAPVGDDGLREALEKLGTNVISRQKR